MSLWWHCSPIIDLLPSPKAIVAVSITFYWCRRATSYPLLLALFSLPHNPYSITYDTLIQLGHCDQRRCSRRTDDPRPRLPCSKRRRASGCILRKCKFAFTSHPHTPTTYTEHSIYGGVGFLGRNQFAKTVRSRLHGRRMGTNVTCEYNVVFPRHQIRRTRDADHEHQEERGGRGWEYYYDCFWCAFAFFVSFVSYSPPSRLL